jgi:hypothetical protein
LRLNASWRRLSGTLRDALLSYSLHISEAMRRENMSCFKKEDGSFEANRVAFVHYDRYAQNSQPISHLLLICSHGPMHHAPGCCTVPLACGRGTPDGPTRVAPARRCAPSWVSAAPLAITRRRPARACQRAPDKLRQRVPLHTGAFL